ncbi:hypothetical protein [Micromonospora sp. SL4-19]|uniref:hypothetical protein n=1 Tax=Micromonospora sp. SL4-19 TaxID=3399129 RepID=UPI003A4D1E8C
MGEPPCIQRLDDAAVEPRLTRLDAALGQLEQTPGRTAELALEAVEILTEVYGEALARVTDLAADDRRALDRLADDELLRHLLLLHRIHPDPVERRVARAVDDLRPQLRARGAEIALVGVQDEVARISLSASSCGGGEALRDQVRELVLTFAPELSAVDVVAPAAAPALIPVATLWQRPDRAPAGQVSVGDRMPQAAGPLTSGGPP